MKTLTIVPEDNMVIVDGDGIQVEVNADPNIHAIQWNYAKQEGKIEYIDDSGKGNIKIGPKEIAQFLPLVESHGIRRDKINKELQDEKDKQEVYEALPSTKRLRAFRKELPMGDQLDEILKFIAKQGGRTPEMDVILAKSKEIKDRFPKEGE